jgi:hypothetical protein
MNHTDNPVIIFIIAFYIACALFYITANALVVIAKIPAIIYTKVVLLCYPVDIRQYLS